MSTASTSRKTRRSSAASRSFPIDQPSVDDTVAILRGLKEKYEVHHGVRITDRAIIAAARLSDRYIADRFLPDKAIDLIDEAAAKLRLELDSQPAEITEIQEKITRLEIEKRVLEKEGDPSSKKRVDDIEREISVLDAEKIRLVARVAERERSDPEDPRSSRQRIEQAKREEQLAARGNDLERLGRDPVRRSPGARQGTRVGANAALADAAKRRGEAQGGGHRRRHRRDRREVDRHSREQNDGDRERKASPSRSPDRPDG